MAIGQPEPVGERELDADRLPRSPEEYSFTDHFYDRVYTVGRYVTPAIAKKAIEYGEVEADDETGGRFYYTIGGVEFTIAVDETNTSSPVVVTGYSSVADREAAEESGIWSPDDLGAIEGRTALSKNNGRAVPSLLRPVEISAPIPVKGHEITTGAGEPTVTCESCNLTADSKCKLGTARCHGEHP